MESEVPYVEFGSHCRAADAIVNADGNEGMSDVSDDASFRSCESSDSYQTAATRKSGLTVKGVDAAISGGSRWVPASLTSYCIETDSYSTDSTETDSWLKALLLTNSFWAIYTLTLLVIFFIAIYIIEKKLPGGVVAEVILIGFMILGIVGLLWCFRKRKNSIMHTKACRKVQGRFQREAQQFVIFPGCGHSNHYLMAGVYIFGTGTLLVALLRLQIYYHALEFVRNCLVPSVSENSTVHIFKSRNANFSTIDKAPIGVFCYCDIIFDVVRVFFTIIQIAFLQSFHSAIFKESIKIKFILYHTMSTNLCVWIKYVVEETHLFGHSVIHDFSNSDQAIKKCLEISEILTPFILEFSLIAAGLLLEISCEMQSLVLDMPDMEDRVGGVVPGPEVMGGEQVPDVLSSGIHSIEADNMSGVFSNQTARFDICRSQRTSITTTQQPWSDVFENKNKSTRDEACDTSTSSWHGSQPGLLLGILNALLLVSSAISVDGTNTSSSARSMLLFTIIQASVYYQQFVALMFFLTQLKQHIRHQHAMRPDDFLLIMAFFIGRFAFSLIAIFTNISCCIKKIHSGIRHTADAINAVQVAINMVTQLFQTILIIFSRRFSPKKAKNKARNSAGRIRQLTLFLMSINLGVWANDSFIEIKNSGQIAFPCGADVFEGKWETIVAITYPFAIFYRFHAAAMLFEFWKRFKFNGNH